MSDEQSFAWLVLLVGLTGMGAVLANRITQWTRIPAPAIMLAAAAVAATLIPGLGPPPARDVQDLVSVALVLILFDGGMGIGVRRFRTAAQPIVVLGVLGTFLTVAGVAVASHLVLGLEWYAAALLATAVAPTDPAVVFSVLGQRTVTGASGTVLEGESGANDPVGIALMAGLISAGGITGGAFGHVAGEFALQMLVGLAVGLIGGRLLLWSMRHVALPGEGLYALRTLACALAIFGLAALLHGSGFLAVFVTGIVLGDARAPYKREIEQVHSALASLGEVVAFVVLGLTVPLSLVSDADVWVPGLALGLSLALVLRPVLVGPLLWGSGLRRHERAFVLLAGLKGAVPILLGSLLLTTGRADAPRLYGIVVVVVVFSVVAQGGLVPTMARRLGVPMRDVEQEPFALGVRLQHEPNGVHRLTVRSGSAADGSTISELSTLPEGAWVSFVIRQGALVPVNRDTALRADDEALVLADPDLAEDLQQIFEVPTR